MAVGCLWSSSWDVESQARGLSSSLRLVTDSIWHRLKITHPRKENMSISKWISSMWKQLRGGCLCLGVKAVLTCLVDLLWQGVLTCQDSLSLAALLQQAGRQVLPGLKNLVALEFVSHYGITLFFFAEIHKCCRNWSSLWADENQVFPSADTMASG